MGAASIEEERRDYALWLKKVLSMHRGATLEEFKVRFCFDINFTHVIDSWLYFASRKAIRKLELDFRSFYNFSHFEYSYSIPLRAFSSNFKNLSSISLSSVDVTDEFLVRCLATCHLLEELRVLGATSLVNVEIVGTSLMLKHLDIVQCESVKHVEISANNLVSFKFHGPKINISFKSIPRLVEVSIESHYCEHLIAESCQVELQSIAYANKFCQFFLHISQLEILKLRMNAEVGRFDYFHNCPPFSALKHLELRFQAYADRSLLFLNSLIDACPSLQKFVIKLSFIGTARNQQWDDVFENVRRTVGSPCHVLKVVEFIGFQGHFADMELAMNLILKAVCLERVSIDPHCVFLEDIDLNYEDESEYWDLEEIDLAREQSKLLAENFPPGIELVMLQRNS